MTKSKYIIPIWNNRWKHAAVKGHECIAPVICSHQDRGSRRASVVCCLFCLVVLFCVCLSWKKKKKLWACVRVLFPSFTSPEPRCLCAWWTVIKCVCGHTAYGVMLDSSVVYFALTLAFVRPPLTFHHSLESVWEELRAGRKHFFLAL